MSSHNPFRDPARLQPSSSPPPSPPPKSEPSRSHPEPSSPSAASTSSPATSAVNPNNSSASPSSQPSEELRSDPTGLTEELPPAYTPGPNVYQGESTVEFGPARPFQQPPRPHPPPQPQPEPVLLQPTSAGWSTSSSHNHHTGRPPSLLQQLTGQLVSQLTGAGNNGSYSRPGWSGYPGQQTYNSSLSTPSLPPRPSSAGGRFAPPPGPPPNNDVPPLPPRRSPVSAGGYEPPSGPPPRSGPSSPHSGPPSAGSQNGRPTTTPVPGHPLLNNNRLLVYPTGYHCDKCRNTGYKHNDPSHPCRKCWARYSKPFSGALMYTDFSPESRTTGNFQRPLPSYHSPQSASSSRPPPPNPGYQPSYITPHHGFRPPPPRPLITPMNGLGRAPRGAIVYPTGDPRIGGRLCWRCEGSGLISFLFLEDNCPVCGGVGRIFN
ncbi:uncharacterized protein EV420DRAFT_1570850 [Desarmillaria tabescens]|uniref:Uncharacterized protein n=1 Tax=Armillaria tabescens TaxID=1929756 RepID=A0AA39MUH1_ARMTA|nr:uncharacterized protein EV420DRAFT_1602126 [Desarmillaria tabescens]XP_060325843.1 uncharacterized protein EV420DRAFT_1570850 [Desarmillaria tabescens]KAK0433059.1 hypothetical protein EV420DRAFT_1602126 [Desarmillaria tabescens]KAK0446494.1 hypothetical protein EV420DRAFT_1570850 [Desarmillaria tabescens]